MCLYQDVTVDYIHNEIFPSLRQLYDASSFDCFVLFVLSHGAEGIVYGSDGSSIRIRSLIEAFLPKQCPRLLGKPKLFFIQACQVIF